MQECYRRSGAGKWIAHPTPLQQAALRTKRRRLAVVLCCGLGLACAVLIGAWLREPSDPTDSAPLFVSPGTHSLRAVSSGVESQQTFEIRAGEERAVKLTFHQEPSACAGDPPASGSRRLRGDLEPGACAPGTTQPTACSALRDARDSYDDKGAAADISLVVGAAAATATLGYVGYLLFDRPEPPSGLRAAAGFDGNGGNIVVSGSF